MKSGRPRILVADDARTMRLLLRTWLERLDCAVVEAKDGTEALAALRDGRFDLAFCDVHMPGLTGLQVLDAVRADSSLKGLPFVLVTTLGQPSDVERAFKLGASDYLKKPVSWGDLTGVLQKWLPAALGGSATAEKQ